MTQINEWLRIGTKLMMIFVMFFSIWTTVYALGEYTPLAPLPCTTVLTNGQPDCSKTAATTKFETYLPGLFNWAIGIAAVMAFVMITAGGITYMTSDSIGGTTKGRGMIENAIWGLVLVIGSYVILYTINPAILSFKLTIPKPAIATGTGGTSFNIPPQTPLTSAELAQDKAVRDRLTKPPVSIPINHTACTTGQTTGCTSLNGLPNSAITGLISLKNACSCGFTITGGTEFHGLVPNMAESHAPGHSVVDIRVGALETYLSRFNPQAISPIGGRTPTKVDVNTATMRATFTYENIGDNGTSSGDHWHVVFK